MIRYGYILKNNDINKNVLTSCTEQNIPIICASSIMIMYGTALSNNKIKNIFAKEKLELSDAEKLNVNTELNNTEKTIKPFNETNWEKNLCYIKEALESLAQQLCEQYTKQTIIPVRFGWTGIQNPYELEAQSDITEIPVYIDQRDLQNFIAKLTAAVLSDQVQGYKTYICVSNHPQNWVNIENCVNDFDWKPQINIAEEYAPSKHLSLH